MTLWAPFNPNIPKSYGGCHCSCHRMEGVYHCVPCCYPGKEDLEIEVVCQTPAANTL